MSIDIFLLWINVWEKTEGLLGWTIQKNWQHRVHKTLNEDKQNLATLGTQDTERRQTKTGNIGYTRYWTKTNTTQHKNTTHNIKKISHTGITEENWVESSELYLIFYLCVCHNFVVLMANKFWIFIYWPI
jgi:hypothetical protein